MHLCELRSQLSALSAHGVRILMYLAHPRITFAGFLILQCEHKVYILENAALEIWRPSKSPADLEFQI